ncbi:hypothetical protein [Poseidonibacter ostreae]|uniref:Uncharacterized protein n=1 Tax=Poseidonibacter ostreae TaxID=2654171 RepID=A0A6L4WWA8_9BACT|nr:hypothetical protein [Poseidonibacter ostreae]KAB7891342.1 hypothetical protein GBG19_00465 [Poseidonibacter ostreae]
MIKNEHIYSQLHKLSLGIFFNMENWEKKDNGYLLTHGDIEIHSNISFNTESRKSFLNLLRYADEIKISSLDEVKIEAQRDIEYLKKFLSNSLAITDKKESVVIHTNIISSYIIKNDVLLDISFNNHIVAIFFSEYR